MSLAADFQQVLDSVPPEWTDLEIDLRIEDESRYVDAGNPEALVGLGIPVLGYYSHVDVETRDAAEAAGVDLVVPRSRMARELPELATKLLAG